MIDDLGRTAVDDLRRTVGDGLAPDDMLQRLHQARRRRGIAGVTSFAVVVLLVVAVALTGTGVGRDTVTTPPAGTRTPTSEATDSDATLSPEVCATPRVTCLGGRRVQVDLPVPVRLTVPDSFVGRLQLWGRNAVEDYRVGVDRVGVTVLEDARPVVYDDSWETDPSAGRTARSVARWLADRPFFSQAVTTRITLDGLPAWRVTPTVRPGAAMPVTKGDFPAAPTFAGTAVTITSSPDVPAEYVLVDVPGAGLTVIWSWSYGHGPTVLAANRAYVDALRFVTG